MAHFTHYVFGETATRRGGGLQTPIEDCGAVCAMMSLSRLLHQKRRCVAALTVISQAGAFATVAFFVLVVCIRTSSTQVCGVCIYVPVRSCDMSLQRMSLRRITLVLSCSCKSRAPREDLSVYSSSSFLAAAV